MEIIVHGTKGGYKVLHQTPNVPFSIARDVRRSDRNDGNPVGQTAYSIAFAEGGYSFSKYLIVRDIERSAVGNIAFSVFISNNQKLDGVNIINLLDELIGKYSQEYIIDGDLGNKHEDWTFVKALINQYEGKCRNVSFEDAENTVQGSGEAAYIYYSSFEELQKYFDLPYQEEYGKYKQIFFVKSALKEKEENPLNALRHDATKNIKNEIDLDNPAYELKDFQGVGKDQITIEILVNLNKKRNRDKINKKDNVILKYSKNRYYTPIVLEGKLTDEKFKNYIHFVGNNKIIIEKNVNLEEEIKQVNVLVNQRIDDKTISIYDALITCTNQSYEEKIVSNNVIYFKGEEQNSKWFITAKNGDFICKTEFVPESQIDILNLFLEEHKKIKFDFWNGNNKITNYSVVVTNNNATVKIINNKELLVIGEWINKEIEIQVLSPDYETEKLTIYPKTQNNPITRSLKKKNSGNKNKYLIRVGQNGKKSSSSPYTFYADGSDVNVIPNKGYEFVKWELRNTKDKSFDGELIAVYQVKKSFPIWGIVTISIIGLLSIGLGGFYGYKYYNSSSIDIQNPIGNNPDSTSQITQDLPTKIDIYLKESDLNLDSLRRFDTMKIKLQVSDKDTFKVLHRKINIAIRIRSAINNGKIDSLRKINYEYGDGNQRTFKNTIDNLNDKFVKKISDSLNQLTNENKISLKSVNDYLNQVQDNLTKKEVDKNESNKNLVQSNNHNSDTKKPNNNPIEKKTTNPDEKKKIKKDFDNQFWSLVRSGDISRDKYINLKNLYKINKDKLEDDENYTYLEGICKKDFSDFSKIDEYTRKNAHKITDLNK